MAKIVVPRSQQQEMALAHPKPYYSRQVGIELIVPAGVGAEGWNFTPALGENLWLLGVDFWAFGVDAGETLGGFISIGAGIKKPSSGGDIALKWEPVMKYMGIKPMMYWWSIEQGHFHWDIMKFYEGQPRMLGCSIQNFSATVGWFAWCFFEISEG